ncbi:hypothetical protein [Flavobacterium chungnamense]|uniref:Uncharacterized protein n=1 Tax=Flavobacterium chungnamense TaxID=706182 RepID=A0ABP7UNL4_9FLAO
MYSIEINKGFSIELDRTNWKLEFRGYHNGLPLYESIGGIVTAIAIVNKPAIEVNAKYISEKNHLVGPIMIPNQRIYRNMGPNGPEKCFWFFSEETINQFQINFNGEIKIGH